MLALILVLSPPPTARTCLKLRVRLQGTAMGAAGQALANGFHRQGLIVRRGLHDRVDLPLLGQLFERHGLFS